MSHRFIGMVIPFLVASLVTFIGGRNTLIQKQFLSTPTADSELHAHALFAPGTDPAYVAKIEALLHPEGDRYNFRNHWSVGSTASNTGGTNLGDSLVLTWSIVPDGTLIPGGSTGAGEPACNSNLIAVMNEIYGEGLWQAEVQEVFDEWANATGNTYIREANDDGAAWPTSRGILGTRGDIRISGCAVDGSKGILAYNYYPNTGDMKIDTADGFYDSPEGALNTGFHYVLAHEHGHGVGLLHACPINGTKLMEPFINTGFNTLRHDDIRGAQRGYGDPLELPGIPNDSAATASDMGLLANGQSYTYSPLSIDDDADQDWIRFTVQADRRVDFTLAPVGFVYAVGTPQCQEGPMTDSKTIHNLDFEILDSDGVTVLAAGNMNGAGMNEVLNDVYLGGAGVKYLRIFPVTTTDDIQLYDLTLTTEVISTITVTPQVGRAGTIFTAQLSDFLPATSVAVSVNGQALGTVTTDSNGSATFGLDSANANDGRYYVKVNDGGTERTEVFVVDANAPLVSGTPSPLFPIPAGVGYRGLYLPLVALNR